MKLHILTSLVLQIEIFMNKTHIFLINLYLWDLFPQQNNPFSTFLDCNVSCDADKLKIQKVVVINCCLSKLTDIHRLLFLAT